MRERRVDRAGIKGGDSIMHVSAGTPFSHHSETKGEFVSIFLGHPALFNYNDEWYLSLCVCVCQDQTKH